jgi:hypothetical protein
MLRLVRRTALTLLLGCLLVAAGLFVAAPASACSCAGSTTQESFAGADAVFRATLLSREPPRPQDGISGGADPALYVFAVEAVYKGTANEEQGVVSPASGAGCGLELSGDGPFIVFATRSADFGGEEFTLEDDEYAAFLCGGTGPATPELETELAALAGSPTDPEPAPGPLTGTGGPDSVEPSGTASFVPALATTGTLALIVSGGMLVRRRRAAS